ncbi:MAG: hypothetical protein EAZ86_23060 [Oscillatoriales cyanobacterium]|nr:MAG: hypothetical protein EAZ86_23060 [Oscillatoriales cyanobacterium]
MPQDFSGKNLRGRNFKGQNLTGAKFIGADIRGANFTNAILREADFTGAKAGLQQRWQIPLLIIALLIAAAAGCVGAIGGAFVGAFLSENYQKFLSYPGIIFSIATVIFLMIIIPHGFKSAFEFFLVIAFVFVVILTFSFGLSLEVAGPVSLGLLLTLVFAVEFSLALALTFAGVVSDTFALGVIATLFGSLIALILVAFVKAFATARAISVVGAVVGIYAVTFISGYISKRALADDNRFSWLKSIAIEYATVKGTTFRNADLTDANFTEATLKSTDFRTANLTRTCFRNTEKLDRARVGNSILADTRIRELLITGNGYKKSYVSANLQGANLTGVNLNEANLKQANLSEATLHLANLELANLTETKALATDFTAASFTGACLEAWNIDGNTKLDRVDCRFVYLLEYPKPGTDDRERCPSSGEFAPVEFTKLFEEVLNTVNLIFRNGIDWKAFVAAFKQLQVENEGTELTIQSIENKGDGVIVVKVSVPPDANKEHIHKNFTQNYELMAARLEDRDKQITFLEGVVIQLAAKPVTIEVKAIAESNSTGNQSSNLNLAGDAIGSTLNIGNIEGTVTNANNEQLESTEEVEEISQAELQAKDAQIERYREEIAFLREMTIKLAKNPIVINSSPDNKPE